MNKARLSKELQKIQNSLHLTNLVVQADTLNEWLVSFDGPKDSLYSEEFFTLKFSFGAEYPMSPPVVTFKGTPPVHSHIYSNGHICLNILADDWSPALTAESVTLSIMSMLSSATEKVTPEGDLEYSRRVMNPSKANFVFHDDKV